MLFADPSSRPCISAIGPASARIMAIGEAPGQQEELTGRPFVGSAGQELRRLWQQAELDWDSTYFTNVLWTRPPENKLEAFMVKKDALPPGYTFPPFASGKYLHPALIPEVERLYAEIRAVKPTIIILLGGFASWAVLKSARITAIRGTVAPTFLGPKALPTFHPAAILRSWSDRPIMLADLLKAERESHFPEIRRPVRQVLIDPTLDETLAFCEEALRAPLLGVDVETQAGSITCLGISTSPSRAISIPFFDARVYPLIASRTGRKPGSYWTHHDEILVRRAVIRVLSSPVPKVLQNGLYDIQYFLNERYPLCNFLHDTMIAHHALHPELPKSLGFLGSVYTNESSWKLLRGRGGDELKRED